MVSQSHQIIENLEQKKQGVKIKFKVPGLLIAIFFNLLITFILYHPMIVNPNQYLFNSQDAGISSYFSSLYHLHDGSFAEFKGMNYPYGEHIAQSYASPGLIFIIKWFKDIFPTISNYTVGILNSLILLSFVLGSLFIYLILRLLKISELLSISGSVGIMLLSPQFFRLGDDFSLALGFVIPLIIWILYKFHLSAKFVWLLLLLVVSIIMAGINLEYLYLISAFAACFGLILVFVSKIKVQERLARFTLLLIFSVLPILFVGYFIKFTDVHECRNQNPRGFLINTAEPECVFIPNHAPFKPLVDKLFKVNDQTPDGLAYIGAANILILLISMVLLIKQRFYKQEKQVSESNLSNSFLTICLSSSIVLFLFSMGLPFIEYPGYVPQNLSFINYVQVPAHFVWPLFYSASILCLFILNQWINSLTRQNKLIQRFILLFIFISLPIVEAIPVHLEISRSSTQTPNYFQRPEEDFKLSKGLSGLQLNDFQAILPLPYYQLGNGHFEKISKGNILLMSELIGFKTGLPLISSFTKNSSITESKKHIQLIGPTTFEKPIQSDFPNRKAILVVYNYSKLNENENNILNRSKLLMKQKNYSLYKLEFDSLFKFEQSKAEENSDFLLVNDFEKTTSKISYSGKGALTGDLSGWTTISTFSRALFDFGKRYEISFWMYNCNSECGQDQLNSDVFLQAGYLTGEMINVRQTNPIYSETIDGCWSKVVLNYSLPAGKNKPLWYKIKIKGPKHIENQLIIDELRIRQIK